MCNCMLINIYLGTIGWKWTGDEFQASEHFLMTSYIFLGKICFLNIFVLYTVR